MIGAYLAWQLVRWIWARRRSASGSRSLGRALSVALLGGIVERFLLRHLYRREELYQLLFTYALVLILADAAKIIWGTQQLSVSRPPSLAGSFELFGVTHPALQSVHHRAGPAHRARLLVLLQPHRARPHRARRRARPRNAGRARRQRRLGLHRHVRGSARSSPGSAGALVTPIKSVVPGMDVEIIVEAFIVVVIGGLGSLWGTFLGALIYGQFLSFGILIFPRFSIFAVFVLMAVILIVRPWGLLGRPRRR